MGISNWFKKKQHVQASSQGSIMPGELELKKIIINATGLSSPLNILEAGACGGEDTLQWASLSQVEKVFAFEPVQKSFDELNNKTKSNSRIKTFKCALSDRAGETYINISTNTNRPDGLPSSSSILQPTGHLDFHSHITFNNREKVVVTTIDEWASENKVDEIHIMWLDMQGAEHIALKGAEKMLATTSAIFSEVSLKPMYANSLLYPRFKEFMLSLGFVVHSEYLYWEDMGNVLFLKK